MWNAEYYYQSVAHEFGFSKVTANMQLYLDDAYECLKFWGAVEEIEGKVQLKMK